MRVKYAKDIIKEIQARGSIQVPEGYITGEAFEEWLEGKENFGMSISEQVKELRECAAEFNLDDKVELTTMLNEAADTIESLSAKLQAANMERSADCGGWIPCKNKMPEIGKPVLVCDKQGNVCVRAITCEIKGKKYWSQDKYDVVAWQPLPEPYHEP